MKIGGCNSSQQEASSFFAACRLEAYGKPLSEEEAVIRHDGNFPCIFQLFYSSLLNLSCR